MSGKNGLHILIQQEESYQNDELFFLGFEKSFKNAGQCNCFFFEILQGLILGINSLKTEEN